MSAIDADQLTPLAPSLAQSWQSYGSFMECLGSATSKLCWHRKPYGIRQYHLPEDLTHLPVRSELAGSVSTPASQANVGQIGTGPVSAGTSSPKSQHSARGRPVPSLGRIKRPRTEGPPEKGPTAKAAVRCPVRWLPGPAECVAGPTAFHPKEFSLFSLN